MSAPYLRKTQFNCDDGNDDDDDDDDGNVHGVRCIKQVLTLETFFVCLVPVTHHDVTVILIIFRVIIPFVINLLLLILFVCLCNYPQFLCCCHHLLRHCDHLPHHRHQYLGHFH